MYENGNMPKKKSPIKAILLTMLILLLLFAGGVVLWGTNGYRIKYEVTLDHINDMCFRFFPPDNSKDMTLEVLLNSENLFSIHLPARK